MIDKLKSAWQKLTAIKRARLQTSMKIIYCYGGGLALMTILMIGAWIWQWYHTGEPDMNSLITIFEEYTAPAVVAAFTFVSVFCVDKDKDGRPDAAEYQADALKQKKS